MVAVNILNKQLWSSHKRLAFRLEVWWGFGLQLHHKNHHVMYVIGFQTC